MISNNIETYPRIMVTGMSAVGKTHLVRNLSEKTNIEVFHFGARMAKKIQDLMKKKGAEDKTVNLSTLSLHDRQVIQRSVIAQINTQSELRPIIIDGHLLVEQGESSLLVPGIPYKNIWELELDAIVMVLDKPKRIHERRKHSENDYSETSYDIRYIDLYQNLYRNIVATYAALYGCAITFLDLSTYDDEQMQIKKDWDLPRLILMERIEEIFRTLNCPVPLQSQS